MKNKRVAKIKSKLFHKLKKREREREEKKLLDQLAVVDPVAAQEYREKQERKRVEERLLQRHSSNNKFAKRLKRFGGGMDQEHTREAFHEMIRERDQLKQKTKSIGNEEDDSDSGDSEMSEEALREKAIREIQGEVDSEAEDGDEEGEESQEEQDLVMKFSQKKQSKGNKKEEGGIMGLKFMQRAEEKEKAQLKENADRLIKQLEEDAESDEEEPKEFLSSAKKFGKAKALTDEQIMKAT